LIFLNRFKKLLKYQISCKPTQWEPSCSTRPDGWKDRRTDMMKLIVTFRNFANAPKSGRNTSEHPARGRFSFSKSPDQL